MEACFLTSNSFNKASLDLGFQIKSSVVANSKGNHNPFHSRKYGNSSFISCCQIRSNSSEDDYSRKINAADWRSFRARLIGGEQAARPESDGAPVDDRLPPITIGERWAHEIHAPEKGCLLIATEKLNGVHIFERTVILLLSTGPVGPTGIILNRPSLMSIKETNSTSLDLSGTFTDRPLFFGGPLQEMVFLLAPSNGDNGVGTTGLFEKVMNGLYFGTKESVGCAAEMVKRDVVGVSDFRFFDGYCGWEKEQLKDEIKAGYWTVAASSPSVIELSNVGNVGLWDDILGLMGHKKVW